MISEDYSQTENAFKQLPYYKAIVKSFIRKQIQQLLEELSQQTGEESIILTVNVQNGTLSHQGSGTAKGFLESRNDIKTDFLSYCISCNAEQFQKELAKSVRNNRSKRPSYTLDDQIWAPPQTTPSLTTGENTPNAAPDRDKRVTKPDYLNSKDTVNLIADPVLESERQPVTSQEHSTPNQGHLLTSQDSAGSNSDQTDISNSSVVGGLGPSDKEVVVKLEPRLEEDQDSGHIQGQGTNAGGTDSLMGMSWGQEQSGFGPMGSSMLGQNKNRPQGIQKRASLTLQDRVCIIKDFESSRNISQRCLASKYKVGKSTVRGILSKKQLYLSLYEQDANTTRKRFNTSCKYSGINDEVYQWYCDALVSGSKPPGTVIQDKALEVAKSLNIDDFKASNGWLHSWKIRYNIVQSTKSAGDLFCGDENSVTARMSVGEDSVLLNEQKEANIELLMACDDIDTKPDIWSSSAENQEHSVDCKGTQQFKSDISIKIEPIDINTNTDNVSNKGPWPDAKDFPESLLNQSQVGNGDEIVSCVFCGRLMASRSLKSHMMSHQSIKRFECDFCDRKFTHKTTLTNHRRLHTGEKPYRCEMCDVAFHALSGLAQHRQSKHTFYGSSLPSFGNT